MSAVLVSAEVDSISEPRHHIRGGPAALMNIPELCLAKPRSSCFAPIDANRIPTDEAQSKHTVTPRPSASITSTQRAREAHDEMKSPSLFEIEEADAEVASLSASHQSTVALTHDADPLTTASWLSGGPSATALQTIASRTWSVCSHERRSNSTSRKALARADISSATPGGVASIAKQLTFASENTSSRSREDAHDSGTTPTNGRSNSSHRSTAVPNYSWAGALAIEM